MENKNLGEKMTPNNSPDWFADGVDCKYVKRIGESCTLNNNCTYPNCKSNKL